MIPVLILIFILGLVIGSFLNVVILRTVSNESIVFPGSKCPKCQTPLKWYHNIPVLSYIFLRGKCAFCHEKISIQYPIVELLTGMGFLLLALMYSNILSSHGELTFILTFMFVMSLIVLSFLIVISGTDIKEMKVSDAHTYSLIGCGIVYSLVIGGLTFFPDIKYGMLNWGYLFSPVLYTLYAIVVSFIFLEVLRRVTGYILGTEAFGDGDSYIFAGIAGSLTSLSGISDIKHISMNLITLFLLSVILSVVFSLPSYIKQLIKNKNYGIFYTLCLFIVYSAIYFSGGHFGWFESNIVLYSTTLLLVVIGVMLCFLIISSLKNNQAAATQIPFGPALCGSGLFGLFVIPLILNLF